MLVSNAGWVDFERWKTFAGMSPTPLGGERANSDSKRHLEPPAWLLQGRAVHEDHRQARHSAGERGRSKWAPCTSGRPHEQGEDLEVLGESLHVALQKIITTITIRWRRCRLWWTERTACSLRSLSRPGSRRLMGKICKKPGFANSRCSKHQQSTVKICRAPLLSILWMELISSQNYPMSFKSSKIPMMVFCLISDCSRHSTFFSSQKNHSIANWISTNWKCYPDYPDLDWT